MFAKCHLLLTSAIDEAITAAVAKLRDRPGQVGELIGPKPFLEKLGKPLTMPPEAYRGSDTVPPCKPGLIWLVSKDMHPVTLEQVKRVASHPTIIRF